MKGKWEMDKALACENKSVNIAADRRAFSIVCVGIFVAFYINMTLQK